MKGTINEQEQRRTGFPWSEGIVTRCRYETGEMKNLLMILQLCEPLIPSLLFTGGTVLAAEVALQRGLASSTAGGTHHAFPSFGSGFCLLNDLAVAAKYMSSSLKRKVLIVDLDVHQVSQHRDKTLQYVFNSTLLSLKRPSFISNRVMALLSFSKRRLACLLSQCIVGKISPSVNNRVI